MRLRWVIARQFIARCYESDPLLVTLQYQNEDLWL